MKPLLRWDDFLFVFVLLAANPDLGTKDFALALSLHLVRNLALAILLEQQWNIRIDKYYTIWEFYNCA